MSISLAYGQDFGQMIVKGFERLDKIEGSMYQKISKFTYQTYIKDLPIVIKDEILGILQNGFSDSIEKHIGDTNKKIIIILPGFFSTTASLKSIKNKLKEDNYSYYALNYRLTYFNVLTKRKLIMKEVIKLLSEIKKEEKESIIFGYSYGGSLAEIIGDKHKNDTISLSTGNDFNNVPLIVIWKLIVNLINSMMKNKVNTLLNTKTTNNIGKENIYKIIEEFSFSVDLSEEQRKKCVILKGIFSHFPINNKYAIDAIMDGIRYFENKDSKK